MDEDLIQRLTTLLAQGQPPTSKRYAQALDRTHAQRPDGLGQHRPLFRSQWAACDAA